MTKTELIAELTDICIRQAEIIKARSEEHTSELQSQR